MNMNLQSKFKFFLDWKILSKLSFGVVLLIYLYKLNVLEGFKWPTTGWPFYLAVLFYCFSITLKGLRLYILAANPDMSLSRLMYLHWYSNTISIALPFRIGDVLRIPILEKAFGSLYKSFIGLISERIFDVLSLLLILSLITLLNNVGATYLHIFAFLSVCLLVAFVFINSIEQIASVTQRVLVSRIELRRISIAFKICGSIYWAIYDFKSQLRGKIYGVFSLSIIAWSFELIAMAMSIFDLVIIDTSMLYLPLLIIVAIILPTGPIGFGGVQLAAFWYGKTYALHYSPNHVWMQIGLLYIFSVIVFSILFLYNKYSAR